MKEENESREKIGADGSDELEKKCNRKKMF